VDLIREAVRRMMQQLMEAIACERIGAGPHERTMSRDSDQQGAPGVSLLRPLNPRSHRSRAARGPVVLAPRGLGGDMAFPVHPSSLRIWMSWPVSLTAESVRQVRRGSLSRSLSSAAVTGGEES
jgi:hypothetical protein